MKPPAYIGGRNDRKNAYQILIAGDPNVVSKDNLRLLTRSILSNRWTPLIVARTDGTIIDGFRRYATAGRETLKSKPGGGSPRCARGHGDDAGKVFGTIAHTRSRGTHQLEPMKAIIKCLTAQGKSVKEIGRELGMKPEEVSRLSEFTRDDFLKIMTGGVSSYNRAYTSQNIK